MNSYIHWIHKYIPHLSYKKQWHLIKSGVSRNVFTQTWCTSRNFGTRASCSRVWGLLLPLHIFKLLMLAAESFMQINQVNSVREQRNHGLKCESDCVRIGLGIIIFMNHRGRFCERSFCWVFVIHTTIEQKHSFCFGTSFHSRCVSYENCKRPRRNYTLKHENSFAILISVCNFHISLQCSFQFAILTFQCIVPTWAFAIFIWVCNFHMSLQFSYQFAILMSQLQHLLSLLCMDSMSLWPKTH